MAGGIFGKQPFTFNEKCIFFSLICMALFLYKPTFTNNYWKYFTLFIIFVVAYVAMAWYDYFFDCRIVPLRKGSIGGVTGKLKPPSHVKEVQESHLETSKQHNARMMLIYASHIIFIVPLLIYLAVKKDDVNPFVYPILGTLAVFTAGYHGVALMTGSH